LYLISIAQTVILKIPFIFESIHSAVVKMHHGLTTSSKVQGTRASLKAAPRTNYPYMKRNKTHITFPLRNNRVRQLQRVLQLEMTFYRESAQFKRTHFALRLVEERQTNNTAPSPGLQQQQPRRTQHTICVAAAAVVRFRLFMHSAR
jgi:hypothetical protein